MLHFMKVLLAYYLWPQGGAQLYSIEKQLKVTESNQFEYLCWFTVTLYSEEGTKTVKTVCFKWNKELLKSLKFMWAAQPVIYSFYLESQNWLWIETTQHLSGADICVFVYVNVWMGANSVS